MASQIDSAGSVQISLSADGMSSTDLPFPDRRIILDRKTDSIVIGRASKTPSKGFLADMGNGWYDSPVMSRKHAEIVADLRDKKVEIRDLGSLHGTYLNNEVEKIPKNELRELKDGDSIKFGVPVLRGHDTFSPTTVKVGISFDPREQTTAEEKTTTTFQVPEGSDDGSDVEDSSSDDSRSVKENTEPIPGPSMARNFIDLTQQAQRESQLDLLGQKIYGRGTGAHALPSSTASMEVIDLSSPPGSPILVDDGEDDSDDLFEVEPDNAREYSLSPRVSSPDLEVSGEPTVQADFDGDIQTERDSVFDDQGSIRLSTDEEDADMTDSDRESFGDDLESESELEVHSSDVEYYDLDESDIEIEIESELDDELDQIDSDIENGQWGTEGYDDELDAAPLVDENGQRVDFWDATVPDNMVASPPVPALGDPRAFSFQDHMDRLYEVSVSVSRETKKTTAAVTIEKLLNDYKPEPSPSSSVVFHPTAPSLQPPPSNLRQASPSDAAMPKSCLKGASDPLLANSSAEALGYITGKHDYFAARAVNRASANLLTAEKPRLFSSVHALCNDDQHVDSCVLPEEVKASRPTQSLFAPLSDTGEDSAAANTAHLITLFEREKTPIPQPFYLPTTVAPDAGATVDQSARRTHLGISDIVEDCHPASEKAKGKRKADDISVVTTQEEQWAAAKKDEAAQSTEPASVPPAPAIFGSDKPQAKRHMALQRFSPKVSLPDTLSILPAKRSDLPLPVVAVEDRPTKRPRLRSIAERVGYATLGGVATGVMIFGTLVLTAPTFS
ncbi:hypothetical protein B0H67DRAFT_552875 [Lasiosphaeris hirsuta]|uniref:FHA domain-containing protein n=1 Tax=Lasiosphaeris hirsuta TaxID=260670 RepID=A0AA40E309_9PEZI|nr:hypothetical protein B0H67DRAFT_552875 [Lasiosphaeris hirsuta]